MPFPRLIAFLHRRSRRGAIATLLAFGALCLWWTVGSLEAHRIWIQAQSFSTVDALSADWIAPLDPRGVYGSRLVRHRIYLGTLARAEWDERLVTETDAAIDIPGPKPAAVLDRESYRWRFTGLFHVTSTFLCVLVAMSLWRWWSKAEPKQPPPPLIVPEV